MELEAPLNRPSVLAPHVLGRELRVDQGSVDLSVSHEAHQSQERDPGPRHIAAEGVAQAMRVGLGNPAAQAVMTKQRTKSSQAQGTASLRSFEGNEQSGRVGQRPFQMQIALQGREGILGYRSRY